jgi:hypothetical protein
VGDHSGNGNRTACGKQQGRFYGNGHSLGRLTKPGKLCVPAPRTMAFGSGCRGWPKSESTGPQYRYIRAKQNKNHHPVSCDSRSADRAGSGKLSDRAIGLHRSSVRSGTYLLPSNRILNRSRLLSIEFSFTLAQRSWMVEVPWWIRSRYVNQSDELAMHALALRCDPLRPDQGTITNPMRSLHYVSATSRHD